MPKNFISMRRTRRVAPERATDLGANHAYGGSGGTFTRAMCFELLKWLIRRGFRRDVLITVRPVARSPENLANTVDKLLAGYRDWWGRRHPIGADREPDWLDYFLIAARCEGNHASHAHVNITVRLTAEDVRELEKRAARRNLTLEVTGNSVEWLEGKASVDQHACKIEYAVFHLLQAGSTFRLGANQTPPFVRRTRERFRGQR